MTRIRFRLFALGLLAVGLGTAAVSGQSGSVDLKSYRLETKPLPGDATLRMFERRDGKVKTSGPDLKNNQQLFRQVAQSFVYKVTQAQYYTAITSGELKARPYDQTIASVFNDLNSYILVPPAPTANTRLTFEQSEYIKEFGAALDEAIRAALTAKGMPPTIIRVNAARMLAFAARSGAPAHAKTILALLNNQFYKGKDGKPIETPPEVLYYALKAAAELLGAYDPIARGGTDAYRHTIPAADLAALIQVLDKMVLNGPPVAAHAAELDPGHMLKPTPLTNKTPPGGARPPAATQPAAVPPAAPAKATAPIKPATPEQLALVRFYRRQAIRALANVRHDIVGGELNVPEVRPLWTVARVAVADPAINPPPDTAEIGEAVIGMCGISPTRNLNTDELLSAIALGTAKFLRAKANDAADKSVPWKLYAARLTAAADTLNQKTGKDARLRPHQAKITALTRVMTDVLAPVGRGQPVNIEPLFSWMQQNPPKGPTRSLYTDAPRYPLNPQAIE
jgi:hypothetical protein